MKKLGLLLCAAAMLTVSVLTENFENRNVIYHVSSQHEISKNENQLGEKPVTKGLVTHLPIIEIDTAGKEIPGKAIVENGITVDYETTDGMDYIFADMSIIDNEDDWNSQNDEPCFKSDITIHVRGNSSRAFDKSSYKIELVNHDDLTDRNRTELLGMSRSSSYVLHGPFLDKTLIRNYVFMNIGNMIFNNASEVRFAEVILNGEYQGVYVLMETIEVSKEKINLREYKPGDPVTSYLVGINPFVEDEKMIDSFAYYTDRLSANRQIEVVYPSASILDENAIEYITSDFSEIERKLYSNVNLDDDDFYIDLIDEDSFVDYYIYQEFLGIYDMYNASTYFYKDARGKLHIGPIWDFNNALDNFFNPIDSDSFLLCERGVYEYLFTSKRFTEKVIDRYRELRESVLSTQFIIDYCNDTVDYLGSAVERNYEVWGYSFDAVNMPSTQRKNPNSTDSDEVRIEDINPENYEEALDMMYDYLTGRGEFLDENIESLRQYYSYSKNASKVVH